MLEFNIRNQEISRIDSFSPAEKSVNYLVAHFNFKTDDWSDDVVKRAVFRNVKTKVEKDSILENDSCIVPWEVLVGSGEIKVSVHGVIGTEDITTNVATFNLDRTLSGGSASEEPTPTVYKQMVEMVRETKDLAQSVRDDANNGVFDGPQGPKGDSGSIEFKIVNELPTEDISESTMYLVSLSPSSENNEFAEYIYVNGHWEYIGSATVEVDLSEYVKNTDYATQTDAGLIKANPTNGFGVLSSGQAYVVSAAQNDIDNRKTLASRFYLPITPSILDYSVMKALTEPVYHEWTDEEKAKALELLGVLAKTSDKGVLLYGSTNGETYMYNVNSSNATAWSIPQRGKGGVVVVGTPTADNHATTKKYVDEGFVGKLSCESDDTHLKGLAYIVDKNNEQSSVELRVNAIGGTVPVRDNSGNMFSQMPIDSYHCANKKYVDDLITELRAEIEALKG